MNNTEIKDIDKLKNLLIEFGVEFEHWDTSSLDYVSLKSGDDFSDFMFTKEGQYCGFRIE